MTAAAASPADMPGARCSARHGTHTCKRRSGHSGNHHWQQARTDLDLGEHTADVAPRSPAAPVLLSAEALVRLSDPRPSTSQVIAEAVRAQDRRAAALGTVHSRADALEVASRALRLSRHRALTDDERAIAGRLHDAIVTRLAGPQPSGLTSPGPEPT